MMTFTYRKGSAGLCYSNIMFPAKWPMRGGKFPKDHPCYGDPAPTVGGKWTQIHPDGRRVEIAGEQPESDTNLGKFRARGYWASCFPDGDGITFEPLNQQSDDDVARDIAECFGVAVARTP